MTRAIKGLALLLTALYGTKLAYAIRCEPGNYAAIEGTVATDEWCQANCNNDPRFCPSNLCQCAPDAAIVDDTDEPLDQLPAEECQINDYITDPNFPIDFCNDTCTLPEADRRCPRDFCSCADQPLPSVAPSPSPVASVEPLPSASPALSPSPSLSPMPSPSPIIVPSAIPSPPVDQNDTTDGAGDEVIIPEECFDFLPAAKAGVDQIICDPGVYVASQNYSDIPGMDLFCTQNCLLSLNRFCPNTHCACGANATEMIQEPSRLNELMFENRTCVLYGSLAPMTASDRFCDRTCKINPELCFDALCECVLFEDEAPESPAGQNCTMQLVCEDEVVAEEDQVDDQTGEDTGADEDIPARLRRLFNLRG